jgi:hypothetical protein
VILKEPDGAVLEVGRLLRNLREQTLTTADVPAVSGALRRLPPDLVAALLRSLVGLYCDPRQDVRVRDNVRLVVPSVWTCASVAAKGEVGIKYSSYSANADIERKKFARELLEVVDGLAHLPESDLALEISTRVARLEVAHEAMDNFYNEPPIAREIRKFIADNGYIPPQINDEYVRVIARCRIGRPQGISRMAAPIYDQMIDLFTEPQVRAFVAAHLHPSIATRLDRPGCAIYFRDIVKRLLPKVVDQPLKRVLEAMLAATDAQLPNLARDARFQKLLAALG